MYFSRLIYKDFTSFTKSLFRIVLSTNLFSEELKDLFFNLPKKWGLAPPLPQALLKLLRILPLEN